MEGDGVEGDAEAHVLIGVAVPVAIVRKGDRATVHVDCDADDAVLLPRGPELPAQAVVAREAAVMVGKLVLADAVIRLRAPAL